LRVLESFADRDTDQQHGRVAADEFEKRKQLEAERDKLTDAQRQQHDSFCAFHHEQKTLTPELAIKAARIIGQSVAFIKCGDLMI